MDAIMQPELLLETDQKIDTSVYNRREQLLELLCNSREILQSAMDALQTNIDAVKARHSKDQNIMNSLLNRNFVVPHNEWSIANGKSSKKSAVCQRKEINITGNLSLEAICVNKFDSVVQYGELYYVESADQFAMILAGHMFHGWIGKIYGDERQPEKIRDCKYSTCNKLETCNYYHSPLVYSGSRDHRNFIASGWTYTAPDSIYKNRQRSRRIGCIDNLIVDMAQLQDGEKDRFYDQMMHDILVALLMKRDNSMSANN